MVSAKHVAIPAPIGHLEGLFEDGDDVAGAALVFCHPHPQYGGSMYDGVLDCAARALASRARACLRFNFRGVGASDGDWDGGSGEVDDVVAAAQYIVGMHPDAPLWIVGYSFGAAMAASAAQRLSPARLILIAPPAGRMQLPPITGDCDVIYGDRDAFIDPDMLREWAPTNLRLHGITGGDHFFAGRERELQATLQALP